MLQPAAMLAAPDQVRRGARAEQHRGVADVLARLEEGLCSARAREPIVDLLVPRMDRRGRDAAANQEVEGVLARQVLDVVFQVVAERGEETAGGFRGGLADGRRWFLRRVLGI